MSKSREFSDFQLRMNEKRPLNTLNRDKNRTTIRSDMFTRLTIADTAEVFKVQGPPQRGLSSPEMQKFLLFFALSCSQKLINALGQTVVMYLL